MKDLLTAIKSELQLEIDYVRNSDIYISEHVIIIPNAIRFPAIGIKDGPITYKIETQVQEEDTLDVTIAAYVQLQKTEASIMGDDSTNNKGVLDMIGDILTALTHNKLGGIVDTAIPVSSTGSEPITDDEGTVAIQMKTVTMRYTKEVTT